MLRLLLPALFITLAYGAPANVNDWIKSNAIPLSTVQAGSGFTDMQPLKKIVSDARIVSLGEATHGTREFFQLKHRMLEFLATEMGFTIFSIEANMPEAYRLNEYVLTGKGDPAELLAGMYFWTWNTKEVLDMIMWMREFNKSGKGRVEFTGFDMQTPTVARQIARDFLNQYDRDYLPEFDKTPISSEGPSTAFTSYTGTFPVDAAAGRIIRFSADIKTDRVTEYAGLWWRADDEKPIAFKNLGNAAPKGTTDWRHYELEITIPPNTRNINFGPLLAGGGTAWFKNLAVTINDIPYTEANGLALINVNPPKSVFHPSPGYEAEIVDGVLRLMRTSSISGKGPSAKDSVKAWQAVFNHLQSARARYVTAGATAKDADWAIQNARIILQCMQMKANEVTRDRSMADNVKWILDQNPKAKIVLWAHNGHVRAQPYAGGSMKPMGAELRQVYGDQMRVFGFAFNRGSFQAIAQSSGLRNFTVPAAPPDSFDATLATAGIPLLALDLRKSPAWFTESHPARSIGALYNEEQPGQFFGPITPQKTFDAILFVENTTAAIPNPKSISMAGPTAVECEAQKCADKEYNISFRLPEGWKVRSSGRWGVRQSTVVFGDPQAPASANPSLYYKALDQAAMVDYPKLAESKAKARRDSIPDYHYRPDSCRARKVGVRDAYTCIAEFTGQNGAPTAEYLTWMSTAKTDALFFGFMPAEVLESMSRRFDGLIETLEIP